jgi:hypothetical protein
VVNLRVIGHDVIDRLEIDLSGQIVYILICKRSPYRVDQNGLLLLYQVGVVRAAPMSRVFFAVEFREFPIGLSDPVDVVLDVTFHVVLLRIDSLDPYWVRVDWRYLQIYRKKPTKKVINVTQDVNFALF